MNPEQPRLRVLHVSKFRRVVGGVETHIEDLRLAQESAGHSTDLFTAEDLPRQSFDADAGGLVERSRSVRNLFWNAEAKARLVEHLAYFQPDIVHFHSVYHQLSSSVLSAVSPQQRRVMTLHDYKLAAPCYLLMRDGSECTACVGRRFPSPGIRYRCVKDSVLASAVCAVEAAVDRPRYSRLVNRFIVPSEYSRRVMIKAGLDADAIRVVRWGVLPVPVAAPVDSGPRRRRVVFAGRLSAEKGIPSLLAAWGQSGIAKSGWELVIAGSGAAREIVEEAARADNSVTYAGWLSREDLGQLISESSAFTVPSLSPESFGLSAAEALAYGVPVLASEVGALSELVVHGVNGFLHAPGDTEELAANLRLLQATAQFERVSQQASSMRTLVTTPREMASAVERIYREPA